VPTAALRPILARDGIFNVRDLGGLPVRDGVVRPGTLVRGDALHRASAASTEGLVAHGVTVVVDLRDGTERDREGTFAADGVPVAHVPVLDPHYEWYEGAAGLDERYVEILDSFGDRFVAAVEVVADAEGGVAYHCAVGKDRTGLLTALLLGLLGAADDVVVDDYARSSLATTVQANWALLAGVYDRPVTQEDLSSGVWSARPETMRHALGWVRDAHGGAEGYLVDAGLDAGVPDRLRARVVVPAD
jgi:protein-tyrosine phosphatase